MYKPVVGSSTQVYLTDEKFNAMMIEINTFYGCDGWWIENGASRRVCYDRVIFII